VSVDRRLLLIPVKLLISGGLILWLFRDANLEEVITTARGADRRLLLAAFLLFFFGYFITAFRWQILLRAQGIAAHILFLVQSFMTALFFNNFLPSTVGGDAVRIYDSWRAGGSKSRALAVVLVDRLLGMVALLLFAGMSLLLSQRLAQLLPVPGIWVALLLGAMLAFLWVIFALPVKWLTALRNGRIAGGLGRIGMLRKLGDAFFAFHGKRAALGKGILLSVLLQTNVVLHFYLIARALGFEVPLGAFFLIVPAAILVMMLPVSINGIGLRETVFVFMLGLFGVASSQAIAFAWIAYGFVLVQGLLGGIVYALRH